MVIIRKTREHLTGRVCMRLEQFLWTRLCALQIFLLLLLFSKTLKHFVMMHVIVVIIRKTRGHLTGRKTQIYLLKMECTQLTFPLYMKTFRDDNHRNH